MLADKRISAREMRALLREAFAADPEASLLFQLSRRLQDPAVPRNESNRSRPHPLWMTLALILILIVLVFLGFTFLWP